MATFAVLMPEENQALLNRAKKEYAQVYYEYSKNNNVFFIETSDLAQDISRKLGIWAEGNTNPQTALVLQLAPHYHGFAHTNFWNWLNRSLGTS